MQRKLPAYPIFVKDPNFSLWAQNEILNEEDLYNLFGERKPIYAFAKVDGETYCIMGNAKKFCALAKPAKQLSLSVSATSTNYTFKLGNASLIVKFYSPLLLDDLDLLSNPVCYMQYEVQGAKQVEISLFAGKQLCYNAINKNNAVRGGVINSKTQSAFMGLKRQTYLSNNDDRICADWGYWYVAGNKAYYTDEAGLCSYLTTGNAVNQCYGEEVYVGATCTQTKGNLYLAFDERISIDYYGEFKKGWYLEQHSIQEGISQVVNNVDEITSKLDEFDKDLLNRSAKFGEKYYDVLVASYRQSIAGHKLIRSNDGKALFLSKENCSNGCIATVDVTYPSAPLYLIYNTELLKGMMRPVLQFAKMPVWEYDFAPHDCGTYPACCGQVYGLNFIANPLNGNCFKNEYYETHFPLYELPAGMNVYDFNMQMPVEESANMLILFYACYVKDGDLNFFKENLSLCEKWVKYLVKYGLKPEDQLCTDDFAGHLKNNLNLAIKAVVGLACYAELIKECAKISEYADYRAIAQDYAKQIEQFGSRFSHLPLTWDSADDTYSLKYNLAFDKILNLGLFSKETYEKEVTCYIKNFNKFGTPLDSRRDYTKSDWQVWSAVLTDDENKRMAIIDLLHDFLTQSPSRIPFGDWFDAKNGNHHHFRARTVQGGCFILLML